MESTTRQWLRKPIQAVIVLCVTCSALILYMLVENSTPDYQVLHVQTNHERISVENISYHGNFTDQSQKYFYKQIAFLQDYKNPCWYEGRKFSCLPYYFLAGMPKCGTTDLFYNIVKHPSIERVQKEPHWWTRLRYIGRKTNKYKTASIYTYIYKFRSATETIRRQHVLSGGKNQHVFGDGSASTFWDSRALVNIPKRNLTDRDIPINTPDIIHHTLPSAKVIVILRNPVERLYSDYLYFSRSENKTGETFHNRVNHTLMSMLNCIHLYSDRTCAYRMPQAFNGTSTVRLNVGLYVIYLQDWLRLYRREQILIIRMEDYKLNRASHLQNIATFLGLEPYPKSVLAKLEREKVQNGRSKKSKRVGDMFPETRLMLEQFYQPYNDKLAVLLNDNKFKWNNDNKLK